MDGSFAGEVPAILQLCKWVPSKFQLKLSEFREAFISPTREQLLLLSYQCEALLLPLTKGEYLLHDMLFHYFVFTFHMVEIWFSSLCVFILPYESQ